MMIHDVLSGYDGLAVAVSGGVDSMTLAHAAHQVAGLEVLILHAVSPAVDQASTQRVTSTAAEQGWDLKLIEAGEFSDPDYLRNPVNRCFFCKSNLYDRISGSTDLQIASGTNMDDLGDFRPGLQAAKNRQVVHPFVEAGMTKKDVRELARLMNLADIAEMPSQPCLASRIETGITIKAEDLAFVEKMERTLGQIANQDAIRCRIVKNGVRIELGDRSFSDTDLRSELTAAARGLCDEARRHYVGVAPYTRGSAFLHGG